VAVDAIRENARAPEHELTDLHLVSLIYGPQMCKLSPFFLKVLSEAVLLHRIAPCHRTREDRIRINILRQSTLHQYVVRQPKLVLVAKKCAPKMAQP
jgi:hypothetical protein